MGCSLLPQVALGQPSAMHECIKRYGGLVWSIARRLSRTHADAEDATQDVFLEIWQHAGRFDEALGSEQGFIAIIARRRLIDRLRKTMAEPVIEVGSMLESISSMTEDGTPPHESIDAAQAARALTMLRWDYRQVIELSFLNGLSQSEIAMRLSMPLGTVKSSMRRGLLELRAQLNTSKTPGPPGSGDTATRTPAQPDIATPCAAPQPATT